MPGFNKTGPLGQGPMTGRRMGACTKLRKENLRMIFPKTLLAEKD